MSRRAKVTISETTFISLFQYCRLLT